MIRITMMAIAHSAIRRCGPALLGVLCLSPIVVGATSKPGDSPANATQADSQQADTTTRLAANPTTVGADADARARELIRSLGSRDFAERETAQAALARMKEAALPALMDHIGCADPEVSDRVAALIHRPDDPVLRVETAVRLLETAKRDRMETAVYMLFESPVEDYTLFVERTRDATGLSRMIFPPVVEMLGRWRGSTLLFRARQRKLLAEKRYADADKERAFQDGSMYYEAEAALEGAWAAVEEYQPIPATGGISNSTGEAGPRSEPTSRKTDPPSRPAPQHDP